MVFTNIINSNQKILSNHICYIYNIVLNNKVDIRCKIGWSWSDYSEKEIISGKFNVVCGDIVINVFNKSGLLIKPLDTGEINIQYINLVVPDQYGDVSINSEFYEFISSQFKLIPNKEISRDLFESRLLLSLTMLYHDVRSIYTKSDTPPNDVKNLYFLLSRMKENMNTTI